MSRIFGGRKEVLQMPLEEGLGYMKMQLLEYEQAQREERELFWLEFMAKVFSNHPPEGKDAQNFIRSREEFMAIIRPEGVKPKEYKWNIPPEILEQAQQQEVLEHAEQLEAVETGAEKGD